MRSTKFDNLSYLFLILLIIFILSNLEKINISRLPILLYIYRPPNYLLIIIHQLIKPILSHFISLINILDFFIFYNYFCNIEYLFFISRFFIVYLFAFIIYIFSFYIVLFFRLLKKLILLLQVCYN